MFHHERRYWRRPGWQVCSETIYEAVYRGLVVPKHHHHDPRRRQPTDPDILTVLPT
jgi:hypothetical protein